MLRFIFLMAVKSEFEKSLVQNQSSFGVELPDNSIGQLHKLFEIIQEHNAILHLVGPCSVEEFATRHVLESLVLAKHLKAKTTFADIGPGGGFPSFPCLILRPDLHAVLIESKERKAAFLRDAATELGIDSRVKIVNRQFDEVVDKSFSVVTTRALDKLVPKLPRLLNWSKGKALHVFAGPSVETELTRLRRKFTRTLLPLSNQRFIFSVPEN